MAASDPALMQCPTVTIDDAPADEDVFGSHEPIVNAVHEVVTTESGGRTIGLEGRWGSGKSTVVKLLTERMDGPDSHVVLFDAWAHEGDPLRRSFLEKLITSLTNEGWVDRDTWHDRREELAQRRRVEHTHPVPKLGRGAIVTGTTAAVITFLLSAAAALLVAGLPIEADWPRWLGLALYGFLVGVVMLVAAWLLWRHRSGDADDTWLTLFSVQSVTESKSEAIETPDPTSIEFEKTFRALMSAALDPKQGRQLVLVVDNLDRVEPGDARSIWATLQTFLHHAPDEREPWLNSLWVVLPYDRAGLTRLWDASEGDPRRSKHPDHPQLADSFIEKSIQVRFEVPRLLLSDWHSYLESTLSSALPHCPKVDAYVAYRLYRIGSRGEPTPRELKQYVNRIGALHRRWQHALPFSSLAYFASLDYPGDEVVQRLRGSDFPPPVVRSLLSEDVEGDLAAVAFNTEPARALQLLLDPLIDQALRSETSGELSVLLDRHGFWETLLSTSVVQHGMGIPPTLTAAARLLEIPESQRPDAEWKEVRSRLTQHALEIANWPPLTPELADRLSALLTLVGEEGAMDIAQHVTATDIQVDSSAEWAEGAHRLLSGFGWLAVSASGAPEAVFAALAQFGRVDGWETCAGRLSVDSEARAELDSVLVERITEAPVDAAAALMVLDRMSPDFDWAPFVKAAAERLRDGAPSQGVMAQPAPSESRGWLEILQGAGEAGEEERTALVEEGIALEYVSPARDQGDDDALGLWLYEVLRQFSPEWWAERSYGGHAQAGKDLFDALLADPFPQPPSTQPVAPLAETIKRMGDFDLIDAIGRHAESEELATALIVELWESERFRETIDGGRFHSLWPHIAGAAESLDIAEFVRALCTRPTFTKEIESQPFAEDLLDMYEAVISTHPDRNEAGRFADWVATSLSAMGSGQWEALASSDDWAFLLAAVHEAAPSARIGGGFAQALKGFLGGVAAGADVSTTVAEQWERTVVPLIADTVRGTYIEGLVQAAVSVGGALPGTFFDLVGDALREPGIFARPQIINGLLPDLVTAGNAAGLSWLIETLEDENVRNSVPEGGFDALKEVVRISLDQDQDADQLRQIAKLIGLDLPPRPDQ